MNRVVVNGQTFTSSKSISVRNGEVIINGEKVDLNSKNGDGNDKRITITIEGNVDSLDVDTCDSIVVNGDVGSIETVDGDIDCGDVFANIDTTGGDVNCKDVDGNVSTVSGDVNATGDIGGYVSTTGGDIKANTITGNVSTVGGDIYK